MVRREIQVLPEGANAEPGIGCERSKRQERVELSRDDHALGHEPAQGTVLRVPSRLARGIGVGAIHELTAHLRCRRARIMPALAADAPLHYKFSKG